MKAKPALLPLVLRKLGLGDAMLATPWRRSGKHLIRERPDGKIVGMVTPHSYRIHDPEYRQWTAGVHFPGPQRTQQCSTQDEAVKWIDDYLRRTNHLVLLPGVLPDE